MVVLVCLGARNRSIDAFEQQTVRVGRRVALLCKGNTRSVARSSKHRGQIISNPHLTWTTDKHDLHEPDSI